MTEPAPYLEKQTPAFLRAALALSAGAFATFALVYCVQPLLPLFAAAFELSAAQSSLLLSVTTFMLAVGLLLSGTLSDAYGRKPLMVGALATAALLTLCAVWVSDWRLLLVLRGGVGLALSGLTAVAMTYLLEEVHPAHRGYAVGLYIAGNALGGMSGRVLGGVLADHLGWQWVLAAMGTLALVAMAALWRFLPPSRHFQRQPFTLRGLGRGFALHLRNVDLLLLYALAFLLMGGMATLYNYVGFHLMAEPFHLSQSAVGLLSLAYVAGMYGSARAGAEADRKGPGQVLRLSIGLMLLALPLAVLPDVWAVLAAMGLFTLGFFGAHSVASSWMGRVAQQARGQAAALYQFFYYCGASVAGTLGGTFWQWASWWGVTAYLALLLVLALRAATVLERRAQRVTEGGV